MFVRVILGVSILFSPLGCMPSGGSSPHFSQEIEATTSGWSPPEGVEVLNDQSTKEEVLWIQEPELSLNLHPEDGRISLCESTVPGDSPLIAGLKGDVLTVVRGDGTSVSVKTPMPEAVMDDTIRLQAKGDFILVHGTAQRLDPETGELVDGETATSFLKYTFLYDSDLNLMWLDKVFARDHYAIRLDGLGGVSMVHSIQGEQSTRYNFSDGYGYELGDVLVIGEAHQRAGIWDSRLVPIELYASQNNDKTAAYGWLEIETGKVKLFGYSDWKEWPQSKSQNLNFGQRVFSHAHKVWALGAGGCGNPAVASVNGSGSKNDWFYVDELQYKPWPAMSLIDTTASGWSLYVYNYAHGMALARMKVAKKGDPEVEVRETKLPQGYDLFKTCHGLGLSIDPVGNIYALGRHPSHVQLFRMRHLQDTWEPVGEMFTGAQHIELDSGYGSVTMKVSTESLCAKEVSVYATCFEPVLDVSHTQLIGYAGWLDKGEMTMITESEWTVSSESGRCMVMQSKGDGPFYVLDWDNAARFTALDHHFDQASFFL